MLQRVLLFLLFLSGSSTAFSQLEQVIHQTFDPGEYLEIRIALVEEYELLPWSGNQILTETYIELYDAAPHVLEFFIDEKERYAIQLNTIEEALQLESKDQVRRPIQYHDTECYEFVKTKIYIPDNFEQVGDGVLRRATDN